jgi:hypothetical protein
MSVDSTAVAAKVFRKPIFKINNEWQQKSNSNDSTGYLKRMAGKYSQVG